MKYEKNRIKIMMIFIFVFIFLVATAIFIGVKISKENTQRKEEVHMAEVEKRHDSYRKIYSNHKNDFEYIQKSIFAEPISKYASFTIRLKENQLTFFIKNDSLEGQKLKDKLLQDEEFIRCAKEILNTDIESISLFYTLYGHDEYDKCDEYDETPFVLTFKIPTRDEFFVSIDYTLENGEFPKSWKLDGNWYFVTRGKV